MVLESVAFTRATETRGSRPFTECFPYQTMNEAVGPGEHTQEEHASKNWITVPMGTANEGYAHNFHSGLHAQSLALQSEGSCNVVIYV